MLTLREPPVRLALPRKAVLAGLGMTSVVPLLAWVYDLGSFAAWFWALAVPGSVALLAVALHAKFRDPGGELHRRLSVAVLAGLLGTVGYDLFRIPFMVLGGFRLLAPIDSYGVLLANASASSGFTDFAGWAYHFSNGVGFAVVYAAVAARRHWLWGVAWAMALETGTILTPFASDYALQGKWGIIAIAYGAHVPYGLALGKLLQRPDEVFEGAHEYTRSPGAAAITLTVAALALWLAPFSTNRPPDLEPEATAAVVDGKLVPEWIRLEPGECALVENRDATAHRIDQAEGSPTLAPGEVGEVCLSTPGVTRLRVTGEPYDGGFVIVED